MRGKKGGLETRLRDKAPHFLNINSDYCHHFHNSVKVFCQPFGNFLEKYDLHTDKKWSTDIRDALKEIFLKKICQ